MLDFTGIQVYEGIKHFVETGSLIDIINWFKVDAWQSTYCRPDEDPLEPADNGYIPASSWEPYAATDTRVYWRRKLKAVPHTQNKDLPHY